MAKTNDTYDIGQAFQTIEDELIASMIRNMKAHKLDEIDENRQWSMWQVEQLKSLEKYKRQNQKKYSGQFKDINAKVEALIRHSKAEGGMQQELEILKAIKDGFEGIKRAGAGGTAEFFRLNERKLEALIKATTDDMQRAEMAVLRMANDQYRKIIFNAQVYANTGAGTYEKAVDMATKDMVSSGLNCVEYKNGARHTLADYAEMAIRTASKRAYLQGEGEKRREWGITTVIVNKRGNPCPNCLPFVGKVFIDDVWSGGTKDGKSPVTGLKYPLISEAISAGLYHPRCKDSHTTYFEGISTPPDDKYTRDELDKIAEDYRKEQKQQYAKRQEEKFGRLAKYSLDPENQEMYEQKEKEWRHVRFRTGDMATKEYAENKRPLANFHAVPENRVVDIMRNDSEEWIKTLTTKEKHALRKYTYNSGDKKPNRFFERLNAMLRGDLSENEKLRAYADTISGALKKNKLKRDIICYRNMEFDPYKDHRIGEFFGAQQFISTSISPKSALDKEVKMIFYVHKGVSGAYIEELSKYPKQREFLLDTECRIRVLSRQGNTIVLEVMR